MSIIDLELHAKIHEAEDQPGVETLAYSTEKIAGRLNELARDPVGGDNLLSCSAQGLSRTINQDSTLLEVFHNARIQRSLSGQGLTSISGALLMTSHAVNKIFFDQGVYDYMQQLGLSEDIDPEEGARIYHSLFKDIERNYLEQFAKIIESKNIQSTDFHRGVSLPSIINRVFGSEGITWSDVGSSAAFPSKRVAYRDKFAHIDQFSVKDYTQYGDKQGIVMSAVDAPINVDRLIAVDPTNPLTPGDQEAYDWFVACRMPKKTTPAEVDRTKSRMKLYTDEQLRGFEFREGYMDAPPVDKGSCDLVTAFTVLTHMDKDHRDEGIEAMLSLLKPDRRSLLVIQDYLIKDGGCHGISTVKTREPFTYGTWVCGEITGGEVWETFKWQNSECRGAVVPGEDFIKFMEATELFQ